MTKPVKPAFAWPGGYQITYVSNHGTILCNKCASDNQDDEEFHAFIHYEGPSLFCEDCNHEMESSYGEVEE